MGSHQSGAEGERIAPSLHGESHTSWGQEFWWRWVFSTDHKVIGLQYLAIAVVMAVVGGFAAYLMRWQLAFPGSTAPFYGVIDPAPYNAWLTMHGTIMMFFVAMPLLLGAFGNYLVPLMVGAADMAFPRLNMVSVWTLAIASAILLASFFVEEGPAAAGWTNYVPLSSDPTYTGVGLGFDLWLAAVFVDFVAVLMSGINVLTTAFNMRAPGLTLMRLPLFVWTQMVAAILFLFSAGPLMGAILMLLCDRHLGTAFFVAEKGGSPLLWQHLFWFFGHPEVYVILLPALGIFLEIFPTFARRPVAAYRLIVLALWVSAALSFVVWAHHMFVSGLDVRLALPFSITTIIISVPFAVVVFALIATLRGGVLVPSTAMRFAVGAVATFIVGGVTGIFLGSPALDMYLHDTYFVVAHFHYTLFPSVVLGGFAGLYYWFPKMTGRLLDERVGAWHFWLTFVAFQAVFVPLFYVGVHGHMRRVYDPSYYEYFRPLMPLHELSTVAAIFLLAFQLLFLGNVAWSLRRGRSAGADPWGGTTLEWAVSSPPPSENFSQPVRVVREPYAYVDNDGTRQPQPQWPR
ncbi:MAG: cbb3-type cytochrome c oxidase subunit I [Candidatus Binatia bacterium]|nr:cbb3-type cytochrome c oxidase subunit I [Candidatus Binatia bacterium]